MNKRYSRQLELFGINGQEKLRKSRVAVVGGNLLADFTLAALASLGVGTLFPVARERTAEKSFLPLERDVNSYQRFFREFDKEIKVHPLQAEITSQSGYALLPYSDVIIDVTHDPLSKHCVGTRGRERGEVLLGYASDRFASVLHARHTERLDDIVADYKPAPEHVAMCEITAGLLAEEVRKILMPQPRNGMKNTSLRYQFDKQQYSSKTAIVGAGALGTWVGIGMALMGIPATIIDDDVVDVTNLNRQFLYYDSVGKPKARVLAEKLSRIKLGYKARMERFCGKLDDGYELVISCVDNLNTRFLLNKLALNDDFCIVNGGTDPFVGNVEAYVPGVSACIACQGGTSDEAHEEKRASCTVAEQSTVISNMVVGGLMLKMLSEVLA